MIIVRRTRDPYGFLRAETSPPCEPLASFLEQDIQLNERWVEELLEIIRAVDAGEMETWEGTGNAFTLTLTPGSAHLYNEYAPEECTLSSADLAAALRGWTSPGTEPS